MLLRGFPFGSSVGGSSTTTMLDALIVANGSADDATPSPLTQVTCWQFAHRTECAFDWCARVRPHPPHLQCAGPPPAATLTVAHTAHRTELAPAW